MTMESPPSEEQIARMLEAYEAESVERVNIGFEGGKGSTARANRLFTRMHKKAKVLRETESGRKGLEALTAHPVVGVRVSAAAETLSWNPELAIPALEQIESQSGREYMLYNIDAKYTLIEYRAGRLNMNW